MSVPRKLIAEMKRMPGEVDAWSLSVEKRSAVLHEIARIAKDSHKMVSDRLSPRWFVPGCKPVSQVGQPRKDQRLYSALVDQFLTNSYVVSVDDVVLALVPLLAVKRKSWRGWRPGWPQMWLSRAGEGGHGADSGRSGQRQRLADSDLACRLILLFI